MNRNKRWRKVLALAVSICMVVTMLPGNAFAAGKSVQDISDMKPEKEIQLNEFGAGEAVRNAAASPLTGEHTNHNGWKTLSGTINDSTLSAGNYVLTGDVTLNQNVAFGKAKEENVSTVICLNGHTINGQNYQIAQAFSKDVTICNCTGNGELRNATLRNISNLNNIKLTGCTISNDVGAYQLTLNGVDVSGGTIEGVEGCNLYINAGTSISSSTVLKGLNEYINDGSVDCDLSVYGAAGSSKTYIYGGTVRGSVRVTGGTSGAGALDTPGILNIFGGTVSGQISIEGRGTCNITGGTITAPITVNDEGTCNITGGTITTKNTTESGETTGAVIVKSGSCNIGGDAQISGCRIDNGGAVSVLGGNCTISGNNIHNNTTKDGGVYVKGGTCTIADDAVISANTATNAGAGVHIDGGTCNIDGTITGNTARYAANGHGGGVYISAGECNIYGTVTKNTATVNGGGVYAAGGICTIYGSIEENTAVNGGGVYVEPGAQVNTRNASSGLSRITNNTASEYGGGVYLNEGTKWDNVCDITRNRAQAGGGIYAVEGCHLTIRVGSISYNVAQDRGGGLYIGDSSASPCIVNITNWVIKNNQDRYLNPDNIVSLNSKITYEPASSAQDTLPYDESGSIMLRNDASFTILDGKHKVDDAISCFDIQDTVKILIAGGFYDKDPAQEPTLTVLDNVKVIELDGDIGHDQYDPDYPWAVYPVKDGIMSGTSNNPVYDGASIEKDVDFSLSRTADIQKLFYWYKAQGAEDSSYVAGLPSNAGNYTIKVGGLHLRTSDKYYTECTFDLTIAKADPSYTVPTGITAQVGKPLSTVTLPEGWAWKDGSTIPQTEGTQTYPAIFTPDDTANYNTVETEIPVTVDHRHTVLFHKGKPATCTENGVKDYYECSECNKCFEDEACNIPISDLDSWKVITAGHKWSNDYKLENADQNKHYHICTVCGEKDAGEEHTFGVGGDICSICGFDKAHVHDYGNVWKHDTYYHWHECLSCGEIADKAAHIYDSNHDNECNICGAENPDYVPEPPIIVYPVITSIAPVADQEYTGKAIEPALTVYDQDGEVITPNNYIVTYTDNVEPGTATVTVTGKAGVLGSVTATFSIVKKEEPQPPQPEKPGKVEIADTSSDFGRIRIFFDRVDAIGDSTMRYQIQSQKVGSDVVKTQYATVGYSYATVRDLAYNAKYNIRIRAYYINENGERIYGDWSDTKTVYANRLGTSNQVMYAAGITKLTAGKTSVAVNLKKVAFTKNPVKITYQIAYRKKGTAKFSYVYTTGTSKTIAGLAKNTNYQFKVRYYYKSLVDDKLVFSPYTALKTVKTAR